MESLSSQDALDAWSLSHASPRCTIAVWTLWVHPSMTHPKVRTSQNHLTISTFSTSAHATSHGPRSSSLLFSTTSVPHISTFFKLLGVATSKNHKGKFGVGHHRKPQRTTVEVLCRESSQTPGRLWKQTVRHQHRRGVVCRVPW